MTPTPETADIAGLAKDADILASMLRMGERIAFGRDADMIERLSAALQSLSAELAEARREVEGVNSLMIAQNGIVNQAWDILGREGDQNLVRRVQALATRATTAEAEARAMREALEPFARALDIVGDGGDDSPAGGWVVFSDEDVSKIPRVGDLRRARRALGGSK